MLPRRFALIRHIDYTGVSGIGVVAYGVAFADGQVVLRWCSSHPATSMWTSIEDMLAVHGHGEATSVEWIDAPHGDLEEIPPPSQSGRRAGRRAAREQGRAPERVGEPPENTAPASAAGPDTPEFAAEHPQNDASRGDDDSEGAQPKRPAAAPRATDHESATSRAGAGPSGPRPPFPGRPVGLIDLDRDEQEERDARNGHLDIDTAPLLYDSVAAERRSHDHPRTEPDRSRSVGQQPSRGGRHRRPDPPERPR